MHGTIIVCVKHSRVFNAFHRCWVVVSRETLDELLLLAAQVGNVKVHEGVCPVCNKAASESLSALYEHRYADAAYMECGSEVQLPPFPWEDDIE